MRENKSLADNNDYAGDYSNHYSTDLLEKFLPQQYNLNDDNSVTPESLDNIATINSLGTTTVSTSNNSNYTLLQSDDNDDDNDNNEDNSSTSSLSTITSSSSGRKEQSYDNINPLSTQYLGIIVSYFCVGILDGSFAGMLYPILVIDEGISSSSYTAW